MEGINFKKASSFYFIGNLFNKGIVFLTVPIFTRLLETADYGIINTYNSWVSVLSAVIGLALHMAIRSAFVDYREKIDDFMTAITSFTLISGTIACGITWLGTNLFAISFSKTIIVICVLHATANALIDNYSMYLMMQYKYQFRTVLMVFPNVISVILSLLFIIYFMSGNQLYLGRIIPTASVTILFALVTCIGIYKKSHLMFSGKYLKYGLAISIPLVLHAIALNILSQSDRIMITSLADASQTGIYSLIYNFGMISTVVATTLDGIWVPWFTEKLKVRACIDINTKVRYYILLMQTAIIGIELCGPEIVKILTSNRNYWEGITIIPPIVISNFIIFIYTLYVNIEHFHKKTIYIMRNTLLAAIVNIVLNAIFVPRYGYVAAAYTTLVSYFLVLLLHVSNARKMEVSLFPIRMFIPSLIYISVSTLIFYIFLDNFVIRFVILFVYCIAEIFIERGEIKRIIFNKK